MPNECRHRFNFRIGRNLFQIKPEITCKNGGNSLKSCGNIWSIGKTLFEFRKQY